MSTIKRSEQKGNIGTGLFNEKTFKRRLFAVKELSEKYMRLEYVRPGYRQMLTTEIR